MIVIKLNKLSLISIKRLIRWFEPFGFGLMKALLLVGLPLLGAIGFPSGEESVKWGTLCTPDDVTKLGILPRKKAGALG